MSWLYSLCLATHMIGLALAAGGATTKLVLLLKSKADPAYLPPYLTLAKTITRLIVLGLVLLTLAGIGLLLLGHALTTLLVVKLALVALIFVLGPLIDNVVEPRFRELAPSAGASHSAAFNRIQRRYLLLEGTATGLFYFIIVMWMLG